MAVASSAKRSGVSASVGPAVWVCSVMGRWSLQGFEAREVVADEVLQRDRHLLPIEGRLREVVVEVEDRCVRHDAVILESGTRARSDLVGPAVAAGTGDEIGISGP